MIFPTLTSAVKEPWPGWPRLFVLEFSRRQLATAAANRRIAEAHSALATAGLAAAQAAAHALHNLQATEVLAATAKADAILEHLASAFAAIKTTFTTGRVFARTAHAAHTAIQLAAKLLKLRARAFVIRRTENLATLRTFLHANFAAECVRLSCGRLLLDLRLRIRVLL
jgi:hypothetical protein